jgi:hypothetical protein
MVSALRLAARAARHLIAWARWHAFNEPLRDIHTDT